MIFFSVKAVQDKDDFQDLISKLKLSYESLKSGDQDLNKNFDSTIIEKLKEIVVQLVKEKITLKLKI